MARRRASWWASPARKAAKVAGQQREKLNRQMAQICDLRVAVPYIAELSARVAWLEAEARQAVAARWEPSDLHRRCLPRRIQQEGEGEPAVGEGGVAAWGVGDWGEMETGEGGEDESHWAAAWRLESGEGAIAAWGFGDWAKMESGEGGEDVTRAAGAWAAAWSCGDRRGRRWALEGGGEWRFEVGVLVSFETVAGQ